jgi:hypothetical protein
VLARVPLAAWFLLGCGLVAATQAGYLSVRDWNPTAFLQVGPGSPARGLLERDLGPLYLAPVLGHDGKYFYLVARHPWPGGLDATWREAVQDPAYRFGRPIYPFVAGLGGTLSPQATLAGLILVQVLSGGCYMIAIAGIARHAGQPAWTVVIGAANTAIYSSAVLLTSDLPAAALVLAGLGYWIRRRTAPSLVLFAAAALTKEYYILTPVALAIAELIRWQWREAASLVLVPLVPIAAWKLTVWTHLGRAGGGENFDWPGGGIQTAMPGWEECLPLGILALVVLALAAVAVVRHTPAVPRWQCAAWGLLGLSTAAPVWGDPADALRVLAPLWWFVVWAWWPTHSIGEGTCRPGRWDISISKDRSVPRPGEP